MSRTIEYIPIPKEKARRGDPIRLETTNLNAMPQNRFEILLDWNDYMGKWIIRIEHINTDTKIAHEPAQLLREYRFEPHVTFFFYDPTGQAKQIDLTNLGRNVRLGVFPIEE